MTRHAFLITIDTEGDNLWRNHRSITTENTGYLPRFQDLCERYGFKPTWLTNYEMAMDPAFVEFGKDVIARKQGEIGMHLHAWNSPPEAPLTDDDWRWQPFLVEYPDNVLRDKVVYMTDLLEEKFQTKMLSHRAGRWAFDERYAAILTELGYQVDCSVTPRVNWSYTRGAPQGKGGTDYTDFPFKPYFINPQDISRSGNSSLLEIPMSIQYKYSPLMNTFKQSMYRLRGKQKSPAVHWLRPSGGNLADMQRVVEMSLAEGNNYTEFMLHSSEFMPDGSPTFKNERDIEQLYVDLEALFSWLAPRFVGQTLSEYHDSFKLQQSAR